MEIQKQLLEWKKFSFNENDKRLSSELKIWVIRRFQEEFPKNISITDYCWYMIILFQLISSIIIIWLKYESLAKHQAKRKIIYENWLSLCLLSEGIQIPVWGKISAGFKFSCLMNVWWVMALSQYWVIGFQVSNGV
jgi:hypothetical protein